MIGRLPLKRLGIAPATLLAVMLAACAGANPGPVGHTEHSSPLASDPSALLRGIPESANMLGSARAPVTLQYFGDLDCPVCRRFTEGALTPLIETEVRAGRLRIEFRSLQTATRDPGTFKSQQIAALAAGEQHRAWYYIELFYRRQGREGTGYVTERFQQEIAAGVPHMDLGRWQADRSDPRLASALAADARAAAIDGLNATPSFLLGKSGGPATRFEASSYIDPSRFESMIARLSKGD
jgi:protein-disulfide isomerase